MKKLHRYQSLPAPVKASLWFTICSIIQKGIAMITVPLFTRLLTLDQYGVFSVYQSWYSIISIFATLNLSMAAFNNGMIKFKQDQKAFISAMQGLSTAITIMIFFLYLLNKDSWERVLGLSSLFIIAMFVQMLFEPAYLFWAAEQRFQYRYKGLVAVTLLIAVMCPLTGIIAVALTEYKAEARIVSFVLIQSSVGVVFYFKNHFLGKKLFQKEYWKFALRFNLPLIPHYLSGIILGQSDRIMISNMVGMDKTAIYSVAYNLSLIMSIVTNAINSSMVPFTYQKMERKEYNEINTIADRLLLVMLAGTTLTVLLGPELITIIAAPKYSEAKWIIPPVVSAVYFMFLYPLFVNIEFYFEENIYITIASIIGAAFNICMNLLFIPIFGYIAAGYTTLLSYMIFVAMHYAFMRSIINKHEPGAKIYHIKKILILSIIVLIQMGGSLVLYNFYVIRYSVTLALTAALILKRNDIIIAIKNKI